MTAYVLLTDQDDATLLVACESHEEAEAVGRAAIFSDGGVSAWLVPEPVLAVQASEELRAKLRDGSSLTELGLES